MRFLRKVFRSLKRAEVAGLPLSSRLTPDPETARRLAATQDMYANTGWLVKDPNRPYYKQPRQQ